MGKPKRAALAVTLLATALALAGCGGNGDSDKNGKDRHSAKPLRPEVLFRFQKFTAAPLVDGGEVTLRSLEGKVVLLGPEVNFRDQPHGTYKLLFNGLYYGSAKATVLK